MNFKLGCDPEVFVKQDGKFRSAHGLIPGDKKNPFKIPFGAVQVDGMALEFNITPAETAADFLKNVTEVYHQLKAMVPTYEVVAEPVALFNVRYMRQQPPEALELGCDPDFNGWTIAANDRPNGDRPFRTASGHVHIGFTEDRDITDPMHMRECAALACQMDFYLGLPSLKYDKDKKRRQLYGKAGCFRPKSYGVEYRTLSNVWLQSDNLIQWVFNNARDGFQKFKDGKFLPSKYGNIEDIINNSDWKEAEKICKAEGIMVPHV